jgi:hypothetical protein
MMEKKPGVPQGFPCPGPAGLLRLPGPQPYEPGVSEGQGPFPSRPCRAPRAAEALRGRDGGRVQLVII